MAEHDQPRKPVKKSASSKPSSTPHQINFGQNQQQVIRLQSMIGNQALQRLLMNSETFYEEAGRPQSDFVFKKRSVQFSKIDAALREYHRLLNETVVKPTKNERESDSKLLLEALDTLRSECKIYLSNHLKRLLKAEKKEKKLKEGKKLSKSAERELQRNRTFTKLVEIQIPEDEKLIKSFLRLGDNQVKERMGTNWKNAVVVSPVTESELNEKALTDDITPPDKSAFGAPTLKGSVGTQPNMEFQGENTKLPLGYFENIVINASVNNPIQTAANQMPNVDQLYQLGASTKDSMKPTNGAFKVQDTPKTATQEPAKVLPSNLFIGVDGNPHIDEIQQGQLGDCYFLSVLTNIVGKNPDHIKQLIQIKGGNVSVDLYFQDEKIGIWKLQRITLPQTVLMDDDGSSKAASYKIDSTPAYHRWWMTSTQQSSMMLGNRKKVNQTQENDKITTNTLRVRRQDFFHAALWMPYLEKAYLRFAQAHGQYGTGRNSGDKEKSGFEIVDQGGHEQDTFSIFYGARASGETQRVEHKEVDLPELLSKNRLTIIRLLQSNDPNLTDKDNIPQKLHISASATRNEHVTRAFTALETLQKSKEATEFLQKKVGKDYDKLTLQIDKLKKELERNKNNNSANKDDWKEVSGEAKATLGSSTAWHEGLHQADTNRPRIVTSFIELIANLLNIGTDHSTGQRNIYSKHAYSVLGTVFKDSGEQVLNKLNHANLDELEFKKIDLTKSIVTLRNPHGGNAPNTDNKGELGVEGKFDLALEQFIRNFASLNMGIVKGGQNAN